MLICFAYIMILGTLKEKWYFDPVPELRSKLMNSTRTESKLNSVGQDQSLIISPRTISKQTF